MASEHVKSCSISVGIREKEIKATTMFYYILAKLKHLPKPSVQEGVEQCRL